MSNAKYIIRRHDNLSDFVKTAERRRDPKGSSSVAGHRKNDWTGAPSFEKSADWAKYGGWEPDHASEFRHLFDDIEPRLREFTDLTFEAAPQVSGFEVNMQAYLDGEPDHMMEWMPHDSVVNRRALCLVIGHSISAHIESEELFVKGQAAIALVRALRLLGFELEIWSEVTVGGYRTDTMYSILTRLHAAGSTMDESAVEFAIGNPSWLRRLIFGYEEGEPNDIREDYGFGARRKDGSWGEGGGYGRPTAIQHDEMLGADLKLDLGKPWYGYDYDDKGAAQQWVLDQLIELGVLEEGTKIEAD
jgi:hypothetical protein